MDTEAPKPFRIGLLPGILLAIPVGVALPSALAFGVIYGIPRAVHFDRWDTLLLLAGVGIVAVTWMAGRAMLQRRTRRIVVALVVLLVCFPLAYWYADGYRRRSLDTAAWASADEGKDYYPRYRMLRAVLRMIRSGEIGSNTDAMRHLGRPDEELGDGPELEGAFWKYHLGRERGAFGMDMFWLELRFDKGGRLVHHHAFAP